jgi:hypothetical protein
MAGCKSTKINGVRVDLAGTILPPSNRLVILGAMFWIKGVRKVVCQCACGKILCVGYGDINNGQVSCGCYRDERLRELTNCEHHGQAKTPTYWAWIAMKKRCNNPKAANYKNYGGRGIGVCSRWNGSFSAFVADMGEKPTAKHSLDRKDVNGNYEPSNCRWATPIEQGNNRRNNRTCECYGMSKTVSEWSRISLVGTHAIYSRLKCGWSPKLAIWTPVKGS